ncbi:MAG TPA: 4-hydroxy-tetrahydrodipicolinate synthase [Casimicrobiaceae bacterium]|jgi:4-hydroxy-tetrahydrodipicolinate synthase|nr:4-hydroxy-tetrahydrodipicolinate synthase [Casimicrobiaceae bacterium]
MIAGSLVAIVTPMQEGGALDLDALHRLIDFHVDQGTAAIVVVGTTGESPTVDVDEHCRLIQSTIEHTAGRVPVIAGTGGNSTREAIELTRFAKQAGADACLSVVPYYNKPTQEGLYRHFRTIAEAVDVPIVLYNVPSRTVADLANDTIVRLTEIPNVVGLKDATSDLVRLVDLTNRLPANRDFALYSGNDDTALAFMLLGGHGVISVTANVAPRQVADVCDAALRGDVANARRLNAKLIPLHSSLFVEANPIPVKWALAELGWIHNELRLPLTPLSPRHRDTVRRALREAGCIARPATKVYS